MRDDGVISPGQAPAPASGASPAAGGLTPVGSPDEVPEALARYGHARLADAIRHVTSSEQETDSYLAHAAAAGRTVR